MKDLNQTGSQIGLRQQAVSWSLFWELADAMGWKGVPHFPPTPGDLAQWREAFERRPELKPCLHRLDNGLAYGMDRTSAAGNGVVPLAAAHAFRTLKAELLDSR